MKNKDIESSSIYHNKRTIISQYIILILFSTFLVTSLIITCFSINSEKPQKDFITFISILSAAFILCLCFILISEYKRLIKIEAIANQAIKSNKAKSLFLSKLSYEIRTPINLILGYSSIALESAGFENKIFECIKKSDIATKHLLTIISSVLDMAALENGNINIEKEPFNLKQEIEFISESYKDTAEKKGISFLYSDNNISSINIEGDSKRLSQILSQVLSNAIKFTEKGGKINFNVSIIPFTSQVLFLHITIIDTGIGMNKEFIPFCTNKYEQESEEIAKKYGGIGLGLAIAKRLIDILDGIISIQSEKGKGTKVTVEIPYTISTKKHVHLQNYNFTGKRILLVEDNEMNLEMTAEILTCNGIIVDCANNGEEAIKKYQSNPERTYDAILMDLDMPKMDGLEATKIIRNSKKLDAKKIPIIALTANAYSNDKESALYSGMDTYITKPIEIEQLLSELKKVF